MAATAPLQTRLDRLRAELGVIMAEHATYKAEADRGSFIARGERARRHLEWDLKYDEWSWLRIQAAIEAVT